MTGQRGRRSKIQILLMLEGMEAEEKAEEEEYGTTGNYRP